MGGVLAHLLGSGESHGLGMVAPLTQPRQNPVVAGVHDLRPWQRRGVLNGLLL